MSGWKRKLELCPARGTFLERGRLADGVHVEIVASHSGFNQLDLVALLDLQLARSGDRLFAGGNRPIPTHDSRGAGRGPQDRRLCKPRMVEDLPEWLDQCGLLPWLAGRNDLSGNLLRPGGWWCLALLFPWTQNLVAAAITSTAVTVIVERPLLVAVLLFFLFSIRLAPTIIFFCMLAGWILRKFPQIKP